MLAGLLLPVALAGYGDPVDGHPSAAERAVHVWIEAARSSPDAYGADYAAGGCAYADFEAAERGTHTPLWWVTDLAGVAAAHAQDMDAHDTLDHTSSDGTTFAERISAVYPHPTIGETLAFDPSGEARHAVLSIWLCSPPHRAILLGDYDEIGVGVSGPYHVADVGLAGRAEWPVIPGASHEPAVPDHEVTFRAVWSGPAPTRVEAVLDGEAVRMDRVAGTSAAGTYEVVVPTDGGCHTWFVQGSTGGEVVRWPEEGSYGWGDCDWTDPAAGWVDAQIGGPPSGAGRRGCAVVQVPGGVALLPLLVLLAGVRRTPRRDDDAFDRTVGAILGRVEGA